MSEPDALDPVKKVAENKNSVAAESGGPSDVSNNRPVYRAPQAWVEQIRHPASYPAKYRMGDKAWVRKDDEQPWISVTIVERCQRAGWWHYKLKDSAGNPVWLDDPKWFVESFVRSEPED